MMNIFFRRLHDEFSHRQARHRLQLAENHLLPLAQQTLLDQHLSACAECRAYAEDLHSLGTALKNAGQSESLQFSLAKPTGQTAQPKNQTIDRIRSRYRRYVMYKRFSYAAGALAVLGLFVAAFFLFGGLNRSADVTSATIPSVIKASPTATLVKVSSAVSTPAVPLPTPTISPANCAPPSDWLWLPYIIQRGDTVYELALRYKITSAQIITANCLANSILLPGSVIYLPPPAILMAGNWVATTDFGKFILTVNDSGTRIIKTDLQYGGWTCGSTVHHSGEIVDASDWQIIDNKFSVYTPFDKNSQSGIYINGTYNSITRKFSGTWEEFSGAITCSGAWEASAPK
jgi:LysM repeat protein